MDKNQKRQGVTLIELTVTILIVALIITAIGVVMLDGHRGWLDAYRKIHGGAVNDAALAQTAFEKIVRKASRSKYLINASDDLTVYYYEEWKNSPQIDRYARFYRSPINPAELYVEHGTIDATSTPQKISAMQLCSTVVDAEFKPTSGGIEMQLILDDGRETTAVLAMAVLHNE